MEPILAEEVHLATDRGSAAAAAGAAAAGGEPEARRHPLCVLLKAAALKAAGLREEPPPEGEALPARKGGSGLRGGYAASPAQAHAAWHGCAPRTPDHHFMEQAVFAAAGSQPPSLAANSPLPAPRPAT